MITYWSVIFVIFLIGLIITIIENKSPIKEKYDIYIIERLGK